MHPYLLPRTRLVVSALAVSMLVAPAAFATKKVEKVEIKKIEKKLDEKVAKKAGTEKKVKAGGASSVLVVPELDATHWAAAAALLGGGFLLLASRRRAHQPQG